MGSVDDNKRCVLHKPRRREALMSTCTSRLHGDSDSSNPEAYAPSPCTRGSATRSHSKAVGIVYYVVKYLYEVTWWNKCSQKPGDVLQADFRRHPAVLFGDGWPRPKHFRDRVTGPCSSYSSWRMHISRNVLRLLSIEAPRQATYF